MVFPYQNDEAKKRLIFRKGGVKNTLFKRVFLRGIPMGKINIFVKAYFISFPAGYNQQP